VDHKSRPARLRSGVAGTVGRFVREIRLISVLRSAVKAEAPLTETALAAFWRPMAATNARQSCREFARHNRIRKPNLSPELSFSRGMMVRST